MKFELRRFNNGEVPDELRAKILLRKEIPGLLRNLTPIELVITNIWEDHLQRNSQDVQANNIDCLKTNFPARLKKERVDSSLVEGNKLFQNLIKGKEKVALTDALLFIFDVIYEVQAKSMGKAFKPVTSLVEGIGQSANKPDAGPSNPELTSLIRNRMAYANAVFYMDTKKIAQLTPYANRIDEEVKSVFREVVEIHRASKPGRPLPTWKDFQRYHREQLFLTKSNIQMPPLGFFQLLYPETANNRSSDIKDFYWEYFDIPGEISHYELSRLFSKDIEVLNHNLQAVWLHKIDQAKQKAHEEGSSEVIIVTAPDAKDVDEYGGVEPETYKQYMTAMKQRKSEFSFLGNIWDYFNEQAGIPEVFEISPNTALAISL